jgi:2,3-bisphosphoglycerate-independent phosphoglycerate mutase
LSEDLTDADPQKDDLPAVPAEAKSLASKASAEVVNGLIREVGDVLKGEKKANYILLRGYARIPKMPLMTEKYGMRCAAVANYPMYRGLAKTVGMEVLETGETWRDEIKTLEESLRDFDFFFVHFKATDKAGEDGDARAKITAIQEFDKGLAGIVRLKPDVMCITGDHSTPAVLHSHSWHPNPLLIHSPYVFQDRMRFTERNCRHGSLGTMKAVEVMPLLLANALKLKKFGA